jgi:hypothetical protein
MHFTPHCTINFLINWNRPINIDITEAAFA